MTAAAADDWPEGVPRCTARSSQTGQACRNRPVRGATVCSTHGGLAPQVKAAALRRRIQAEAADVVFKLLHDPDAPPITDPTSELAAVVGRIGNAVEVLGGEVNRLERLDYTDDKGVKRAHVVMEAYRDLTVEYRKALADMVRLGIEDRAQALSEAQGAMLATVIRGVLDAMLGRLVESLSTDRAAIEGVWPVIVSEVVPAQLRAVALEGGE